MATGQAALDSCCSKAQGLPGSRALVQKYDHSHLAPLEVGVSAASSRTLTATSLQAKQASKAHSTKPEQDAAATAAEGAAGPGAGAVLQGLEALWDEHQYDEENALQGFLQKLR